MKKTYESGMQRDQSEGKPRYDLIFPLNSKREDSLIHRWAVLLEKGATHYGDRNWEKAKTTEDLMRFKESAFRHFMSWFFDEDDEDHAASLCFNVQGVEYVRGKLR